MGLLKTGICIAMLLAAPCAALADEVTEQDAAPVGKPVLVPLINTETDRGIVSIYVQEV